MTHLLDSDTCIDHLRRGPLSPVTARLNAASIGSLALPSVVVAELLFGAMLSNDPAKVRQQVDDFCIQFAVLPFDEACALEHARIRSHLTTFGLTIGSYDSMIAAVARENGLILVTHNTSEFGRVPNLRLEDWQVP